MAKTRGKPLTVINMISFNGKDGDYKPLEECTEEELALFRKTVSERGSKVLSDYYSNHPEEYEKLLEKFAD